MGKRKVRCFTYDLKLNDGVVDNSYFKEVIQTLFNEENNENIRRIENGNLVKIITGEDIQNYLSIELIERVEKINTEGIRERKIIDEDFLFFRIGRQKDIDGALKRNIETWEGQDIIDIAEQGEYNLEICTYILIDIQKGIILELFGKYAPSVNTFKFIINKMINDNNNNNLNEITMDYKNIMSDELINALKENATRLGQITYNYENPNLDVLKEMGFSGHQINTLRILDIFELEVNLKARPKNELTRVPESIREVLNALEDASDYMKKHLTLKASTSSTSSKNYTFKEEEVTYNVDIPYDKIIDGTRKKLTLDEIAFEVYLRLENMHNDYINDIERYILRN